MSTRVRRGHVLKSTSRRKTILEVDLNAPPSENQEQDGTSGHANFQVVEPPAPIDVEAFDDDVVISSRRAFIRAKYNSIRHRGRSVVVDVDSEERTSRVSPIGRDKRRRVSTNQQFINGDLYVNLEGSSNSMRGNAQSLIQPLPLPLPPLPPPPPNETTFRCPICMGPFVEEMSTKCGHVFCKACIKAAIAAQGKCPTCRRKVTIKDTIRIYLPASN